MKNSTKQKNMERRKKTYFFIILHIRIVLSSKFYKILITKQKSCYFLFKIYILMSFTVVINILNCSLYIYFITFHFCK